MKCLNIRGFVIVEELRARTRALVHSGHYHREEVEEILTEEFVYDNEEGDPVEEEVIEGVLEEVWSARVREQESWPEVTDCDRLTAAFADMARARIVARENYTCCNRCGFDQIRADAPLLVADEPAGYLFYHEQDTMRAVDGGGLWLAFAAVADDADATAEIGRKAVEILRAHGLEPVWDGDPDVAVHVPMVWRRRVPDDD